MNYNIKILFLSILLNCFILGTINAQTERSDYLQDLPFNMVEISAPQFPSKIFNISEFGAVGDGIKNNREYIQKAIDVCSESGGGRVLIPAGIWLTGPIELRDNVDLHLMKNALVKFSENFDDYPIVDATFEGVRQYRCKSPVSAKNLSNIAITGDGIIDGAGDAWRPVKKYKMTENQWKELISKGGIVSKDGKMWWPSESAMGGEKFIKTLEKQNKILREEEAIKIKDFLRPVMIKLVSCKNVLLEGVTFQNSPAWNIHPLMCENMIIQRLNVRNPWYSQNGDGLDLESCKNTLVYDCKFDVGDDAICLKSGKNSYGRERGIPTENVVISDCTVYHGHGGFTIGSEMSGGIKNIKISNCSFLGTDVGIRFKSNRGRGGIVENIFIDHIYMKDIPTTAVSFNMYYGGQAPTETASGQTDDQSGSIEVSEETPIFRKIYMSDIYCSGAQEAVVLQGLPEMPINEIVLDKFYFTTSKGITIADARNISISDSKFITNSGSIFRIKTSRDIKLDSIMYDYKMDTFLEVNDVTSLDISDTKLESFESQVNFIMKKDKNEVRFK